VDHAGARAAILRRQGVAYTAGVLASFGVVAGVLIALRAGGERLGWGFQLQSPLVVTVLAEVLFVLGLSLSGVMLIGGRLTGAGQALTTGLGYTGSFFTGALATVAATPCTAPFMAVAVVLAGLVLIGLATWLYAASRTVSGPWRRAATATVAVLALAAVALGPVVGTGPSSPTGAPVRDPRGPSFEPFSPRRVAELRAQGIPVFVNFTAAWCITCLVNERLALRSPAVA